MDDLEVPPDVLQRLLKLLRFLACLLKNSSSKAVFFSVDEVSDLLSCWNDDIADAALQVLYALSIPSALHKQHTPEVNQSNTALHTSKNDNHTRLVQIAKGYGTKGMGLGLLALVTTDDSVHGQGSLPEGPGELYFTFHQDSRFVEIHLGKSDVVDVDTKGSKRRKVDSVKGPKSTAELYFLAIEKCQESVPNNRLFSLVSEIRMARSFHCRKDRIRAVNRRLFAIISSLYTHPSQEVIVGYFQAQPELCVEIVDLLRPTVSVASVSRLQSSVDQDSVAALASSDHVPFRTKILALEALTSLLARRDASTGPLAGPVRLANVLSEIGVAKGQYLGLLPTLIRYCLSFLGASMDTPSRQAEDPTASEMDIDVGLAFLEATRPQALPRVDQVLKAFEFVDSLFILTSIVVATPTGTPPLTESGLIPALMAVLSVKVDDVIARILPDMSSLAAESVNKIRTGLRFITIQVIQILEGAIVTHGNALTAFRDQNGVEAMVSRLGVEFHLARDTSMDEMTDGTRITSSTRALLFAMTSCLTVIFHQESSSSTTTLSGGRQLRGETLTAIAKAVFDKVEYFHGHIASSMATLLTDIMNSEPQVVHYVHESGIAESFLRLLHPEFWSGSSLRVPPVSELIMSLTNFIAALCLTEAGASKVASYDPYPNLMKLLYSDKYTMPKSRCLLAETTAVIGTGLDEIIRHTESHRHIIMKAVIGAIYEIVYFGRKLGEAEWTSTPNGESDHVTERTCLIQYVANMGHILDQLLHTEENSAAFFELGGLKSLLDLYPATLPRGKVFLVHLSGLSSPSVSSLHHSTIEDIIAMASRYIFFNGTSSVLDEVLRALRLHFNEFLEASQVLKSKNQPPLESFPVKPIHLVEDQGGLFETNSRYLRALTVLQWCTTMTASCLKALNKQSRESGSSWTQEERKWKLSVVSEENLELFHHLSNVYQDLAKSACEARCDESYEEREKSRLVTNDRGTLYTIRIVCPEGAVVRDGIEIDRCASLGNMDMGEVVVAFDRCINSCGILRYHTERGWISEMTRGHGREPIAEVVRISNGHSASLYESPNSARSEDGRREAGVLDLQTVAVGVMIRSHIGYSDLFSTLSKLSFNDLRDVSSVNSISFDEGSQAHYISNVIGVAVSDIRRNIEKACSSQTNPGPAEAIYLGLLSNHLCLCLFDDKPHRGFVNFPLLLKLLARHSGDQPLFFRLISLFLNFCLDQLSGGGSVVSKEKSNEENWRKIPRCVAASFGLVISLVRSLLSAPFSSTPAASVISRISLSDMVSLMQVAPESILLSHAESEKYFQPELLRRTVLLEVSGSLKPCWGRRDLNVLPPHLLQPLCSLVGDIIVGLSTEYKKKSSDGGRTLFSNLRSWFSNSSDVGDRNDEELDLFEPDESVIEQLAGMGFDRDQAESAIESTRSNRLEVVMEYALAHRTPMDRSVLESLRERRRDRRERGGTRPSDDGVMSTPENGNETTQTSSAETQLSLDLEFWTDESLKVCVRAFSTMPSIHGVSPSGDGESEAFTVVMTSFFIEVLQKYPDRRIEAAKGLFESLKSAADQSENLDVQIPFSCLSHSSLILVRAFPSLKTVLLQCNVCSSLVGSLERFLKTNESAWPVWFSPCILLLDALTQPASLFSRNEMDIPPVDQNELEEIKQEHLSKSIEVSRAGKEVMAVIKGGTTTDHDPSNEKDFSFPPYFPMLTEKHLMACQDVCETVIRRGGSIGEGFVSVPPGLVQGALTLQLHLLGVPAISERCRKSGLAEAILALPRSSMFTGHSGVVALIFRRLMEDEATLQLSMESEIRLIVAKLRGSPGNGNAPVGLSSFLEAITPMICRDTLSFLRAVAVTVEVDKAGGSVSIISKEEAAKRYDRLRNSNSGLKFPVEILSKMNEDPTPSKSRSKSPGKSRRLPAVKKKKQDRNETKTGHHSSISPSNHIVSLLLGAIIRNCSTELFSENGNVEESGSFLWVGELLEVLADLAIGIPSCAAAVLNYRPLRSKNNATKEAAELSIRHAISGCPLPPRNFVTFLLHSVFSYDRWSLRNDSRIWERKRGSTSSEIRDTRMRKLAAQRVSKAFQNSARVLVALVSRPGEGRKRVLSELAFALSGGRLGHGCGELKKSESESISGNRDLTTELNALQFWGELCQGMMSSKYTGRGIETISSLNLDTVRLMLECRMPHALLHALHRVDLVHPMASSTVESLLTPFEVMLRPSVFDECSRIATKTPAETHEGCETGSHPAVGEQEDGVINGTFGVNPMDDEITSEEDEEPEGEGIEHDLQSNSSSSESESDSSIPGSDEEMEDSSESSESSSISDEIEADDWEVDFEENFLDIENPQYREQDIDPEEEFNERGENLRDDGWTRIESNGFGGIFLGSQRGDSALLGETPSQNLIEVAEAVVGTLYRNGEVSDEAIHELESSLGIRLPERSQTRDSIVFESLGHNRNSLDGSSRIHQPNESSSGEGNIAILPYVNQRSQPEIGFRPFGGALIEACTVEYVYGGPTVSSGIRNYDIIPRARQSETDDILVSQLDLQLFPVGSTSAVSPRAQSALHPMYCGVDLSPPNAILVEYVPQSVRASRQGLLVSRRPGDWVNSAPNRGGYLVTTANGNIIRSSRNNPSAPLTTTAGSTVSRGPIGWTDDGQPVDASINAFRSSLEVMFRESANRTTSSSTGPNLPNNGPSSWSTREELQASIEMNLEGGPTGGNLETVSNREDVPREDPAIPENDETANLTVFDDIPHNNDEPVNQEAPPDQISTYGDPENEAGGNDAPVSAQTENEGEQMASSLAGGLVLSSSSSPPGGNETNITGREAMETDDAPVEPPEPYSVPLTCPPGVDPEVFASLPEEMQRDCVEEYNAHQEIASQIEGSNLDPAVLAELPEDMRREIIEQDRRERERLQRLETDPPADPAHAEEMDSASFIASLPPELREEVLLTADETLLSSLPPNIRAEAQIIQERATTRYRNINADSGIPDPPGFRDNSSARHRTLVPGSERTRRKRAGRMRIEKGHESLIHPSVGVEDPISASDLRTFTLLFFLLSPIRPPRLLQRCLLNMVAENSLRFSVSDVLISILHENRQGVTKAIALFSTKYTDSWRREVDILFPPEPDFPPTSLLGAPPDIPGSDFFNVSVSASLLRRKTGSGTAATMAACLPKTYSDKEENRQNLPPVVLTRVLDAFHSACKNSNRFCVHLLTNGGGDGDASYFDRLLDLLDRPAYAFSSSNLDQLLSLIEAVVGPLSYLPRYGEDDDTASAKESESLEGSKEWIDVPRPSVTQGRLRLLCSMLRMESCRESAFTKVNTIVRRLCRIEDNRGFVLSELASVAHGLGLDAVRDLRTLRSKLEKASRKDKSDTQNGNEHAAGNPSATASVTFSTSTSELKLLRVLQTLQSLCSEVTEDNTAKRHDGIFVTEELVELLRQMEFGELWDELSLCLDVVKLLEGVAQDEDEDDEGRSEQEDDNSTGRTQQRKKLKNSSAGVLSRFLPAVEAFFIATASSARTRDNDEEEVHHFHEEANVDSLVDGKRFVEFTTRNRILLNALIRTNSNLLDKGLKALVQVRQSRSFLDFDVKRHWFKNQMRRLRQHASRRYGNVRLVINRETVFQDAYNQLRPRNADEMRGRLHVTFHNEEGVDAGGLTREFFGILGKEIFNPNYALFTSTEDGATFQPNPNSSINPDHLSFFRFVGRIVGKAIADGYLLDAHFTRSLYKHMLGVKPTHEDMEAIDPDYYRNLKTILEYDLEDIGLELTFSIEDHSFGRSRVIDLIPNGRQTHVTEENKAEYVQLVCQHRMTTSIHSQIKAYLAGFYELVSPEMISIFNPKELELLISGLPDIDVSDLKKNTVYHDWKATDKEIGWFWNCVFGLNRNQKAAFLQFVTGSSKVPLAGFAELQGMRGIQKFSINKAGGSKGALMSAHTCFNSLDLPKYESEEETREKLLYAITEGGGSFLFA